jgi:hypothetical protein
MPNNPNPVKWSSHGDFERRDIGIRGVLWFLASLAVAGVIITFVVSGFYHYLQARSEAEQTPVSPMVTNAPKDTRHLPTDYKDYLKQNFPSPQLEIDERTQLNQTRLNEEQTLATYGWVDQKGGVVRIPIERAMDLIAQRGLPVRGQTASAGATAAAPADNKTSKKKGSKQ